MNRFLGFADNGGMPVEKFTPAVAHTAKPKTPTKPKVRLAGNAAIDDEDGFIPEAKKGNNMTNEIDRGPYAKMLDRMALAHQAQFGGSYEQAYTKIYTDPTNSAIRYGARLDHLSKAHDAMHGTRLSLIPAAKAAAPMDPSQDYVDPNARTPAAHAELDRLVVTRMKNNPRLSYQQAFTTEYLAPENRSLKERIDNESILRMQGLEPAKPFSAYAR
jgi:hypothetical protein